MGVEVGAAVATGRGDGGEGVGQGGVGEAKRCVNGVVDMGVIAAGVVADGECCGSGGGGIRSADVDGDDRDMSIELALLSTYRLPKSGPRMQPT